MRISRAPRRAPWRAGERVGRVACVRAAFDRRKLGTAGKRADSYDQVVVLDFDIGIAVAVPRRYRRDVRAPEGGAACERAFSYVLGLREIRLRERLAVLETVLVYFLDHFRHGHLRKRHTVGKPVFGDVLHFRKGHAPQGRTAGERFAMHAGGRRRRHAFKPLAAFEHLDAYRFELRDVHVLQINASAE